MDDRAHSLVHMHWSIRPGGGPSGYLYNLRQACRSVEACPIGFAAEVFEDVRDPYVNAQGKPGALKQFAARVAPRRSLEAWVRAKARAEAERLISSVLQAQIERAEAVVVHDCLLFHHYLNWRARFGPKDQLAVLMDHSPRTPSDLVADEWADRWDLPGRISIVKAQWEPIVMDAFGRADALLVPNRHSLDAYFPEQADKRSILFAKPVVELASGVSALRSGGSRDAVRRELGIGSDALVVGYLGRYEREKGYDIFLETARRAITDPQWSDMRFVAAGYGSLETEDPPGNLIQLGWRRDAAALLNVFDILLAPNRVAYFDLVILEAMSLGKTVYTTFVGGSKGLAEGAVKYLRKGSPAEVAQEFLSLAGGDGPLLDPTDVRRIFAENYSEDVFLQRHLKLASDVRRQLKA
jgi:glycosyltransferase involved in cell wall biosynthesis